MFFFLNISSTTAHLGASNPVAAVNITREAKNSAFPDMEATSPDIAAPKPRILYRINSATTAMMARRKMMDVLNFIQWLLSTTHS